MNHERNKVTAVIGIGGARFDDITFKEGTFSENLLTPGLQTAVVLQSFIHSKNVKNFDEYKDKDITVELKSVNGKAATIRQRIYRMDNRSSMPINLSATEEFALHACDPSLLEDAKSLVSKSWKCKQPSQIVDDVLSSCIGVSGQSLDILSTSNPEGRDYIAEKIHPFQVVAQQGNVALDQGNDPSYLHYMTYNNGGMNGTHHFRSLKNLSQGQIKKTYYAAYESGDRVNYGTPDNTDVAVAFSFPCDFDLLADTLNGLDNNGMDLNILSVFNESSGLFQMLGEAASSNMSMCGRGANFKISRSNKGTAGQHNACETDVEQYLLKRQARMSLLEKDKVALRLVGPWDPDIHVGDIINFIWNNKYTGNYLYGSGTYIVSGLNHNIQLGGFSTTTLDCVSVTAGTGVV